MLAILQSLGTFIIDLFKSRRRLETENLFLRHQLSIALRRAPSRFRLRGSDCALLKKITPDTRANLDKMLSAFTPARFATKVIGFARTVGVSSIRANNI